MAISNFLQDDIDPVTGQKRKATQQLQTVNPNSQNTLTKLSSEAMPGSAGTGPTAGTVPMPDTVSGNNEVLEKAQQSVVRQPQTSPLQEATTAQAVNWVQNPSGGYDPQQVKQATIESNKQANADSMEAMRRLYGSVSGSGLFQKEILDNAIRSNVQESQLRADLDRQNYDIYVDSLGRSSANAQAVNQQNENIFSQRIGNAATVRGMGEGERSQEQGQKNIIEQMGAQQGYTKENIAQQQQNTIALQKLGFDQNAQQSATEFGYDLTKLKTVQDYTSMQQDIQNKLTLALQSNDAGNAQKLEVLRGQIAAAAQQVQQQNTVALQKLGFDLNAQQAATEFGYDLTKIKTAQDFTAIQQDIQNKLALAMQSNDSVNAQKLETLRGQITSAQQMQQQENAIKLQKLGFDQTTQTLAQQFGYDLTKLKTVNDFTAAQEDIKNKLAVSMQGTDIKAQQDLTTLKGKIDAAAQQAQQKNSIELMNLGYEQDVQKLATQQGYDLVKLDKTFGNDITKLITATDLDTQSKSSLMALQDQLDSGKLLTQQNFTAIQNDLDRQLTIATQSNDITAHEKLTTLKGQIDSAAQAAQNEFSDAQRIATQSWQTGENISEQDFEKAAMYYDWAQKQTAQSNDILAQQQIEQMRANTELSMQMNGMQQEEKMAFLESKLAESAASGDFARQKGLMTLAYTQDLSKMATEQGYDVAKIAMQGQIETALQEGNFDHAEAMQNTLLTEQAKQASLNRGVQTLELMLQQKGIDLNAQNVEWDRLKAGVEAGTIKPDVLRSFLEKTATTNGLKIEAPDPMAVYKEVQQQMQAMKQEFGLTHPDMVANPATGELNAAGQKAFNDFFNKQMYSNDVATSGTTSSTATSAAKTTTQKTSPVTTNVRQW